jgi:ribulose-bisphosphate carboxylase large chain
VANIHEIKRDSLAPDSFTVVIHYNQNLASSQIPQLLNLVYGNISLKRNIKLIDVDFPRAFLKHFPGPNFGVAGIRRLLGVYDRPLIATALKPRGAPVEAFAKMAYRFALGGGDIVKDDHNLADNTLYGFAERVERCQGAVQKANAETGGNCLYIPNLSAPYEQVKLLTETALHLGVRGVMVAPFILGLDCVRHLVRQYPLIFIAHPAFTGAFFNTPFHGMSPGLMLGKIFRMIGADISVFPNYSGRFSFTRDDCFGIAQQLHSRSMEIQPAFPAPAGGMRFENIPEMVEMYGKDAIFLIGGALLRYSDDLKMSTEAFLAKVRENSPTPVTAPSRGELSSREFTGNDENTGSIGYLPFRADYSWGSRKVTIYKASAEVDFKGVTRQELIGKFGEKTGFDLRYFEIEPAGFSSLEKHDHTHVIISIRGHGILQLDDEEIALYPNDIAYVAPMQVHQLRNNTDKPFGFFCLVDRERDRPKKP